MNRTLAVGVLLLAVGLGGYVLGIAFPYPGRAFSMLGMTLLGLGMLVYFRRRGFL